MTDEQLQAIKARRAAITPGEWTAMEFAQGYGFVTPKDNGKLLIIFHTNEIAIADATFIAAAPADIDALLAEVERLTGVVDAWRNHCNAADDEYNVTVRERDAARLEVERLTAAIRNAETLSELTHLVGSSPEEDEAACARLAHIDALYKTHGDDPDVWPYSAHQQLMRLNSVQHAYECRYA